MANLLEQNVTKQQFDTKTPEEKLATIREDFVYTLMDGADDSMREAFLENLQEWFGVTQDDVERLVAEIVSETT